MIKFVVATLLMANVSLAQDPAGSLLNVPGLFDNPVLKPPCLTLTLTLTLALTLTLTLALTLILAGA